MDKTEKLTKSREPRQTEVISSEQQNIAHQKTLALAVQHHTAGDLLKAEGIYQQILQTDPNHPDALHLLGMISHQKGENDRAVDLIKKALTIKPNYAGAYNNLGTVLQELGKLDDAVAYWHKAIDLKPNYASAHSNLGAALQQLGRLDEAVAHCHKALATKPDYVIARHNLGSALRSLGILNEAMANYRKALAIKPDYTKAGRNLLLNILYAPGFSPEDLFAEHVRFSENHTRDIPRLAAELSNDPTPDRQLRVGYLSSDFWDHPVGRNILPLLPSHDRTKFEIYCYADVPRPDAITERFRFCVDHWHTIVGKSDVEVARMVRDNKIDVLVCLASHFDNNRPLVCAHRAAPVQVSFHDAATSGLEEMDYLLTDNFLNPPETKEMFTEELYRLPVFYQYPPIEDAPPVSPLPAKQAGFITFGSFNNPAKVNGEVIGLWAEVLKSVPGSQLLFNYYNWYKQASLRDSIIERFAAREVELNRIVFSVNLDTVTEHLGHYGEVDIALDPFPFNGATTTFQALWMGVPVVSLTGETFNSRIAGSILHHARLGELVADTPEAYVACARDLAEDLTRLGTLRATLRERVVSSPLCDAPTYAGTVETAYRDMWRKWCTHSINTP